MNLATCFKTWGTSRKNIRTQDITEWRLIFPKWTNTALEGKLIGIASTSGYIRLINKKRLQFWINSLLCTTSEYFVCFYLRFVEDRLVNGEFICLNSCKQIFKTLIIFFVIIFFCWNFTIIKFLIQQKLRTKKKNITFHYCLVLPRVIRVCGYVSIKNFFSIGLKWTLVLKVDNYD